MTIRDIRAIALVGRFPRAESVGRRVYAWFPEPMRDTRSSRAKKFFASEPDVNFVEIGAYDGIAGDPIRRLILTNPGWKGVLVEPQPDAFRKLKQNYAGEVSRLHVLNAAISDTPGQKTLCYFASGEGTTSAS